MRSLGERRFGRTNTCIHHSLWVVFHNVNQQGKLWTLAGVPWVVVAENRKVVKNKMATNYAA
jgi:hypothetical protein